MPLAMYEYLEVNLIGVVLLLIMLYYARKRHDVEQTGEKKHFARMLVLNASILLTDNGIYLLRGHVSPFSIVLNHAVCGAYFMMHPWFRYEWARYVQQKLYPRRQDTEGKRLALMLPALLSCVPVALSPATGLVYTLSEQNVYARGPLVWITFAAAILYWAYTTFLVLRERLHPSRGHMPGEYRALLFFPLFLIAGNLLQLRFYGLSIVWICAAITMLILFVDMLNSQLSRDHLTGLFSRGQMDVQLQWEAGHLRTAAEPLFVVMLDVDHFKQINDRYGHLAGDKALVTVAEAIRRSCRRSDFASRFGGDEFLLIGHVKNRGDAERIIRQVGSALRTECAARGLPVRLSLSAGYTVCEPGSVKTVDELLGEADAAMYKTKRTRNGRAVSPEA